MPVILKLTMVNGTELYINANCIEAFYDQGNTGITYIMYANDTCDEVKESPREIYEMIQRKSVAKTETTIYTDGEFPPHIMAD